MLLHPTKALLTSLILAVAGGTPALAETYPQAPIKIVVPWPAGGAGDFLARIVADRMSSRLSQTVIVENKPGAATNIGTQQVARAKPDGYTLLLASSNNTVNTSLYPSLGLDFIKDFKPISNIGLAPSVLVVNSGLPASTVKEFIAYAQQHSDELNYGSSGNGSASHLAAEMFKEKTGIKAMAIPYKGSAPAITDLVANRLSMMFTVVPTIKGHVESGSLKALCVLSNERLKAMPQVPTADEAGLTGLRSNIWYGLVAPAGTPDDIIKTLQNTVASILREPDVASRLADQGTVPIGDSISEFTATIADDTQRYAALIKSANITAAN